jgi:hypothetical protein
MLRSLSPGGTAVIAGTESAWRLLPYGDFDRVLLLDPTHPQWTPEAVPWLDPRNALLLACAYCGTRLDVIEFGLSTFDSKAARGLTVHPPYEPDEQAGAGGAPPDTNPLPLKLREPQVRRLIYFNRLGSSRRISCTECGNNVSCPRCHSHALYYSRRSRRFHCPHCGLAESDLRCSRCGLAALAARLPGLEAMQVRDGEVLLTSADPPERAASASVVLGTSQLLEPPRGFRPQQVVYIDPEEREALDSDWRNVPDMALRLAALYASADFETAHAVSGRLAGLHTGTITSAALQELALQQVQLRRLAGLPPYSCLYRLRALAGSLPVLSHVRDILGRTLGTHPQTVLLRLGSPFRQADRYELHGLLSNPELGWPALQELRWEIVSAGASLGVNAKRGPWL